MMPHEASHSCDAVRNRPSVPVDVHPRRQGQCPHLHSSARLAQSQRGLDRLANLRRLRHQPQYLHSCAAVVPGRWISSGDARQATTALSPGLDWGQAAHLVAIACSPVPDGHDHWTVRLLAGKAVELGFVESILPETIRQLLKKSLNGKLHVSS
jgi:hypothetical protein